MIAYCEEKLVLILMIFFFVRFCIYLYVDDDDYYTI